MYKIGILHELYIYARIFCVACLIFASCCHYLKAAVNFSEN